MAFRYSPTKVLELLGEVAQVPDVKIDWNELGKKTSTVISNAREYQMLWRHLAYRDALADGLDNGAEPLDLINIENNFSPEEEAKVHAEYDWAFEGFP
ncbi:hypothetical protein U1Q18_019470 [Sarracenia purpurea var. burkii]